MRMSNAASRFRRGQAARALRSRYGARMGSRSGATISGAMRRAMIPEIIEGMRTASTLQQRNYESRLQGLSGYADIMRFLEDRRRYKQATDQSKPGLFEKIAGGAGILTDVLGMVPGPWQVPAAATSAVRRVRPAV